MEKVVKALYNCSFDIWNMLMEIAMTLFTTSPKEAASGGPYVTVYVIYIVIKNATIPLATVFFMIALYKTVVSSPPEQQAQRFFLDTLKYCMILFLSANMWSIMGYIMDFADGITQIIGVSGTSYELSLDGDLKTMIENALELPEFELSGEWFEDLWEVIGCALILMIAGIILILIMIASCMSIISCAFQRILKPLMMLPFSGIAVALGAGGHEISRSTLQFIKTFFSFCISGAMMIVAIKIGVTLCTDLVSFDLDNQTRMYKCIIMTVQSAITPIVIAGLVKGSDSIIARML